MGRPRGPEPYLKAGRTGDLRIERADLLPEDLIYVFLDSVGDGTGTINANEDYSGSPETILQLIAPAGYEYAINRLLVTVEDGFNGFSGENYGAVATLTNGIEVAVHDANGNQILDLTSGLKIQSNAHWARHCFDAVIETVGSGNSFLRVRWTFESAGDPLVLLPGCSLRVLLQDDLTGLIGHYFMAQGWRRAV